MDAGNIPTPIFNRKRPRQAIFAHPNNSQSTCTGPTQNPARICLNAPNGRGQGNFKGQTTKTGGYPGPSLQGIRNPGTQAVAPRAGTTFGQQFSAVRPRGRAQSFAPNMPRATRPALGNAQKPYMPPGQIPNPPANRAPMRHPNASAQCPYYSPAMGNQPWGNPAMPSTSGYITNMNLNTVTSGYEEELEQPMFTDSVMYPTSGQPAANQVNQIPYPPPKAQSKPPPLKTTQTGKNTADKFKIKTKNITDEQNALRLLTATVNGVKQWMKHKDKIPLLFEVFGSIKPINAVYARGSADVQFTLQDETGMISAVFYEIDRPFPKITMGQTYRLVGLPDKNQMKFHCVSVRPASTAELQLYLSAVNASDSSMTDWASMNEQ